MKLTTSLSAVLAACAVNVVAQDFSGLPTCAQGCATNAIPSSCGLNVSCICSASSFITSVSCCVATACDEADQQKTEQFAAELCSGVGVTTLPAVAACPSTSSASGSQSSASATSTSLSAAATSSGQSAAFSNSSAVASSISSASATAGGSTTSGASATGATTSGASTTTSGTVSAASATHTGVAAPMASINGAVAAGVCGAAILAAMCLV